MHTDAKSIPRWRSIVDLICFQGLAIKDLFDAVGSISSGSSRSDLHALKRATGHSQPEEGASFNATVQGTYLQAHICLYTESASTDVNVFSCSGGGEYPVDGKAQASSTSGH